jgi:hypothetical protein
MATQAQRLSSSAQEDRGRSPTVRVRRRVGSRRPGIVVTPLFSRDTNARNWLSLCAIGVLVPPLKPGHLSLVGKSLQPPFAERHESRRVLIAARAGSFMHVPEPVREG